MSVALSRRTIATGAVGFLAILLVYLAARTVLADQWAPGSIAAVGNVVIAAFASSMALQAARRIPRGERLRLRWATIGFGVASYVAGEIFVAYYHISQQYPPPFPGIQDAFFALSTLALALALVDAALAVRRFGSFATPLVMAFVVALAMFAISNSLLREMLLDDTMPALQKAFTIYRPTAGIFFGVMPALLVVFAVAFRGGVLGFPWLPVAAGMALISLTDTAYSWLSWEHIYQPGQPIDALWMCGYMLIALGALMHMDVDDFEAAAPPEEATD